MASLRGAALGVAGEQRVDAWARQADLRCFKPDPDVIGVDRFIEVSAPFEEGQTLDLAERSTLAWLQIKTTTSTRLTWPVKLDICARFVDADVPTFFLLLHMDAAETLRDAYLLHVDEVFGTEVLRTLRSLDPAEHRGRLHLHDFRVRWNHAHRLEPSELRERLLEAIGPVASYAERKRRWRETAGYSKLPSQILVRSSPLEMARHLLGQVESVQAEIRDASETRFGIRRQLVRLMQPSIVRLGLTDGVDASFRVRRGAEMEDVPGTFWSILHAFPDADFPEGANVWRFHGGLLQVLTKPDGSADLELSYESERPAALHAWRRSATAARLLFAGKCELSIGLRGKRVPLGLSEVERPPALDLSPIEVAVEFAERVGIDESIMLTGSALERWHEDRVEALGLAVQTSAPLSFALPVDLAQKVAEAGAAIRMVHPVVARLGKVFAVAYLSREADAFERNPLDDGRVAFDAPNAIQILSPWTMFEDLDAAHRWLVQRGQALLSESRADLAIVGCGYSIEQLRQLVDARERQSA